MKQRLTPRWLIIKLSGVLFAIYSAYSVFIFIRDYKSLNSQQITISLVVVLAFALMSAYALSFGVKIDDPIFLIIRRAVLITALSAIFVLKQRMSADVVGYLSFSKPHTVFYCIAYDTTRVGLIILLIYYIFIRNKVQFYPKARVILPVLAAVLFQCSFILETILLIVYRIGLEESLLRTIVSRPVFFLGFIGLSVYFLFLPKPEADQFPPPSDENTNVTPERLPDQEFAQENESK